MPMRYSSEGWGSIIKSIIVVVPTAFIVSIAAVTVPNLWV